MKFSITVEKKLQKKLSPEQLGDQLRFIANSAKRSASAKWSVSIPGKLIRELEIVEAGLRKIQYTAVITISKTRYKDEDAVRRRFDKTKLVMAKAANRQGWTFIGDEALVPNGTEYVVVNGAGEAIGDPAPRVNTAVSVLPKPSRYSTGEMLPPLTDDVMKTYFHRIYDREAHIRIVYDNIRVAVRTGFKTRHHILLKGPPACISGDAMVEVNRAGKSFKLKLSSLYRRFNGIAEGEHGNARWGKDISTEIRAMDADGCLRLYKVAGVLDSGMKETVAVTTEDNKVVRATLDHRFYTRNGWKHLCEIKVGDEVAVDGGPAIASGKKHGIEDNTHRHFVAKCKFVRIVSIEDKQVEHVYDVQLDSEPHNFLANGFVVHNCAKTELFLAFIDWLGDDFIEAIDGGTMTKAGLERLLLQKSQDGTLKPILLLEEIEKCHPDNVSCLIQVMDARGKIQRVNANTVRDGNGSAACPIIVWGTCNDDEELKKAHKGAIWSRFSSKMDCQRPDRELMTRILLREVSELDGDDAWVDPVIKFCFDELAKIPRFKDDYDDPRVARAMLVGGERILDGTYFNDFRKTNKISK